MSEKQTSNNIQLSSDYYFNKNVSDIIMPYFTKINSDTIPTIKSIATGIGILITVEIIKSVTLDFIKEQKKQINEGLSEILKEIKIFPAIVYTFSLPYNTYMYSNKLLDNLYKKLFDKNKNEIIEEEEEIMTKTFEINVNQFFMHNLLTYVETNENCSYEKKYDNTFVINKNNIDNKIYFDDISIHFDEINILIKNKIIKTQNTYNIFHNNCGNIFKEKIEEYYSKVDYDKTMKVKFVFKNNMCIFVDTYYKNYSYIYGNESSEEATYIGNIIFTLCLYPFASDMFNNNDFVNNEKNRKIVELSRLIAWEFTCIINNNRFTTICELYDEITKNKITFDYNNAKKRYAYNDNIQIEGIIYGCGCDSSVAFIVKKKIRKNIIDRGNTGSQNNDKNKILLEVKLTDIDGKEDNYITEIVKKFIVMINNLSINSSNNKKIKIYSLKVINNVQKEVINNPKHTKYINDKNTLMDENKDIKKEKIIELLGIEPEKEITKENNKKDVKQELINERFASFNNLYLPKSQETVLNNLYSSFTNDADKIADLGILNKLCILLHGEPGTGKTTTIITTASYFGRDIFYISLRGITNEDLKMMFDFIHNNHSNSGVIIFEDIDAMTNVVKKRDKNEEPETCLTDILETENNALTLDYFLNVLDGTLTCDGSIIIMTTNHKNKIDPALYRPGRVDKVIEMKKSDYHQIKNIFKRFMDRDIDRTVLNRIKEYQFTPADIIFRLKDFIKIKDTSDEEIMKIFLE